MSLRSGTVILQMRRLVRRKVRMLVVSVWVCGDRELDKRGERYIGVNLNGKVDFPGPLEAKCLHANYIGIGVMRFLFQFQTVIQRNLIRLNICHKPGSIPD